MAQTSGQTDYIAENKLKMQCDWGAEVKIDAKAVKESLLGIQKEIAPCKPRIIGVTKYYGLDSILKGYEAGLRDFGESRAVEAVKKIESLPEYIRKDSKFHFIGHLQTNKVNKVVRNFDYIHSVDSLKLASAISEAVRELGRRVKLLLQVNNAGEVQKSGYSKEGLLEDMPELLKFDNLEIVGLMNIAPLGASEVELKRLFGDIREFSAHIEKTFGIKLGELSMGMSDDYKIAVQEGATMIRVGRKLFIK